MTGRFKIKRCDLIIVLIFFAINQGFNIINASWFQAVCGNQQAFLSVLLIFGYLFSLRKFKLRKSLFCKEVVFFTAFYFVELIISSIKNGQGLTDAFIASNFYLGILFYFVCLDYIERNGMDKFIRLIIVFATIKMTLCWIQYFMASKGIVFMNNVGDERFGSIRLHSFGGALNNFAIIMVSSKLLANKKNNNKLFYYLFLLIGILGMLIVSKGRMQLLALFASLATIIFIRYHKNKKIVLYLLLGVIACFAFLQSDIGQTYLQSVSDSKTDTWSIRLREWDYYNNQTKNNIVLGVGFIRDNGDAMSDYLTGPAHQYSRTDIGIMGVANALGIIGAFWYLWTTVKMIWVLRRCPSRDYSFYCLCGIITYSIFSIITVILFNSGGVTVYAMMMALVDMYSRSVKMGEAHYEKIC